ncbi:MAG: UDP-N-acetylglucosamine 2-epimerase [Elusimicrobia bacterium GWA2_66_18]|nr:MAG: UDP-N-acetylglucosamine 2-epimerase [Elusimicrobia bacterium GWA2_66_18]
MRRPLEVLAVVGTRPEAVKAAPVVWRLRRDPGFRVRLLSTGQHREILVGALAAFGLRPDRDLRVMRPRQPLNALLTAVIAGVDADLALRAPDLLLVQGDTTSALGAALAAFHRGIPVAHLEAGLRSGNLRSPEPEEMNRIVVDRLSCVFLAPTPLARRRLLSEGIAPSAIYVTGNTVVDALQTVLAQPAGSAPRALAGLPAGRPLAVVPLHRRESHGKVLRGLISALRRASARRPEVLWVLPAHPNPAARAPLSGLPRGRFVVTPPLPYPDFLRLLARCAFTATDSGGIQEEAPSLGVPFLVLRNVTERPEALGRWGRLAGVEPRAVEEALVRLAARPPRPRGPNPFGDGRAAARAVAALKHWAGRGPRPRAFRG